MRIDLYLLDVDCGWLVFKCLGLAAPVFAAPGRLLLCRVLKIYYRDNRHSQKLTQQVSPV